MTRLAPAKFVAGCLTYCGVLLLIQGAVSFVFLHSFQGTPAAVGVLLLSGTGAVFLTDGLRRWQRVESAPASDNAYGLYEYVFASFAVALSLVFVGFLAVL